MQVLIPERMAAQARTAAERARVSLGEWVRRALEQALAEECTGADPLEELAGLGAPPANIDRMLAEIEAGRGAR